MITEPSREKEALLTVLEASLRTCQGHILSRSGVVVSHQISDPILDSSDPWISWVPPSTILERWRMNGRLQVASRRQEHWNTGAGVLSLRSASNQNRAELRLNRHRPLKRSSIVDTVAPSPSKRHRHCNRQISGPHHERSTLTLQHRRVERQPPSNATSTIASDANHRRTLPLLLTPLISSSYTVTTPIFFSVNERIEDHQETMIVARTRHSNRVQHLRNSNSNLLTSTASSSTL